MEDKKKINAILKDLKKIDGTEWIAAEGFHYLLAMNPLSKDGTGDVDLKVGATVKVFFNPKTGEAKTYLFRNII